VAGGLTARDPSIRPDVRFVGDAGREASRAQPSWRRRAAPTGQLSSPLVLCPSRCSDAQRCEHSSPRTCSAAGEECAERAPPLRGQAHARRLLRRVRAARTSPSPRRPRFLHGWEVRGPRRRASVHRYQEALGRGSRLAHLAIDLRPRVMPITQPAVVTATRRSAAASPGAAQDKHQRGLHVGADGCSARSATASRPGSLAGVADPSSETRVSCNPRSRDGCKRSARPKRRCRYRPHPSVHVWARHDCVRSRARSGTALLQRHACARRRSTGRTIATA